MSEIKIDYETIGRLFNGELPRLIDRALNDAQREVAQDALAQVQFNLDRSIRQPTPYYETQITMQNVAEDIVVHDRRIVYGPWLEGTSERNRTTRFKGYASFRRARQTTQARVPQLVNAVMRRMLGG